MTEIPRAEGEHDCFAAKLFAWLYDYCSHKEILY